MEVLSANKILVLTAPATLNFFDGPADIDDLLL